MFRRHRGALWTAGRVAIALPASIMLGMLFGVLIALSVVYGKAGALGEVEIMFLVGGFIGAVTSPAFILVSTSRAAVEGAIVVSAVTAAAAIGSGILARAFDAGGLSVLATTGVYLVACVMWRTRSGSGAWIEIPGLCPKCGYDLAGLSSGICPECGVARKS